MGAVIYVALGGALGAVCRYLVSSLPMPVDKWDFPFWTLIINFAGAFVIGFVTGVGDFNKNTISFWKTGFCGGFTTFSTFSLETFKLLESQKYVMGGIYIAASIVFCLLGVVAGNAVSSLVVKR